MRARRSGPLLPLASNTLLGLTFLGVGVFAAAQTLRLQQEQQAEALSRARAEAGSVVGIWTTSAQQRAALWASDLLDSADLARTERRLRDAGRYFDGFYLWNLTPEGPSAVYPTSAPAGAPDSPCLTQAAARATSLPLTEAAQAWADCRDGSPEVSVYAVSQAALLLISAGAPQAAWEMLGSIRTPIYAPLSESPSADVRAELLLTRRLLASEALANMNDRHRQGLLLARTGREVGELSAPLLASVLPRLDPELVWSLHLDGEADAAVELASQLRRAHRLVAGWRAATAWVASLRPVVAADLVDQEIAAESLQRVPVAGGQIALLAAEKPGNPSRVIAVQLSGLGLAEDLLALANNTLPGQRPVVSDHDGVALAGALCAPTDAPVTVSLAPLLSDAQLSLCQPAGPDASRGSGVLLAQLAPVLAALLLGGLALLGRVAAERRQRELYERQRSFIARVTHELKTPLAGIRVMAETLEMGAVPPARQASFAARIVTEVERLGDRIDEVLRVARREEVARHEPVDPAAVAADVAAPWAPRFAQLGVSLELDLRPCPTIQADRALLADALSNLLDNALKYRREDRAALVRFSCRPEGRTILFEVVDNGLGVPPDQRKAIFEPFARVEGPGRGRSGGHGLGLSFVAETARVHGAQVECREGIDGGARFLLRLRRRRWTQAGWRAWWSSKTTRPSSSDS